MKNKKEDEEGEEGEEGKKHNRGFSEKEYIRINVQRYE